MTGSSGCLVILLFLAGESCEVLANHYTAVRWLSGQDYAQTHQLHQPSQPPPPTSLSLASAGVSGRPLFSWDIPTESGISTEGIPQSTPSDFNLKTGYKFAINIEESKVAGILTVQPGSSTHQDHKQLIWKVSGSVIVPSSRPPLNKQRGSTQRSPIFLNYTSSLLNTEVKPDTQREYNQIKEGVKNHPRNVWWPWKNYKEWSRSRGQNNSLKQVQTNNSSKTSIQPRVSMVTKLKRKHKKKHRKKNHSKNHKNKKPKSKLNATEEIINLWTNYEQIVSRIMFNMSAKYINKTATSNDTICIMLSKKHCNGYLSDKHNNELKTIHSKSDTVNKYESKAFNRIKSTERSYPLITDYLKRSLVFMRKEDYVKGDGNECLKNHGGCEGLCINLLGTSACQCPPGFRLDSSTKKCQDINECIARNGHGPCQGECTNTRGGYHCSCANLTGTRLANDGHSCEDIDECNSDTNRLNCSHGCINTVGTAFCHCPDGYELGPDWNTCQDIDECTSVELQSEKCLGGCVNTEGSYKCL